MSLNCPVCGSAQGVRLYPEYAGRCITSQMAFLEGLALHNRCCAACGFIFNAEGVRGRTADVYTPENWKPKPQVLSFAGQVKGQQERALAVFEELHPLPASGRILDFGAGRGQFLRHFAERHPHWELFALEPGGGQLEHARAIPQATSWNKAFHEVNLPCKMDVIVVMSVLEHMERPLEALRWIAANLADGGLLYMQHPDFANLPGDLLCVDHLGKLTVPHTELLCAHSGLRCLARQTGGVMFSFVCEKAAPAPLSGNPREQLRIARAAEATARASVACVARTIESAAQRHGKAAIFGTSPVGSMAPYMLGVPEAVAWLVDENANTWGRRIGSATVIGPQDMARHGITDVALAISPRYWETVAQKLAGYAVQAHIPEVNMFSECNCSTESDWL